jgi:hypothetical protein
MKKVVGLWIDHRKAVIVTIKDENEEILVIESNMEKHVRFSNGTHSNAPNNSQGSTNEDVRDRQFGDQLEKYYEEVIVHIRGADSILIFGPGEAKVELENQLKHDGLGARIEGIETVDKMTDPQITAKVRDHFSKK